MRCSPLCARLRCMSSYASGPPEEPLRGTHALHPLDSGLPREEGEWCVCDDVTCVMMRHVWQDKAQGFGPGWGWVWGLEGVVWWVIWLGECRRWRQSAHSADCFAGEVRGLPLLQHDAAAWRSTTQHDTAGCGCGCSLTAWGGCTGLQAGGSSSWARQGAALLCRLAKTLALSCCVCSARRPTCTASPKWRTPTWTRAWASSTLRSPGGCAPFVGVEVCCWRLVGHCCVRRQAAACCLYLGCRRAACASWAGALCFGGSHAACVSFGCSGGTIGGVLLFGCSPQGWVVRLPLMQGASLLSGSYVQMVFKAGLAPARA